MDLGVGIIQVLSTVTSRKTRALGSNGPIPVSYSAAAKRSMLSAVPVFLLGLVRLAVVSLSDYQVAAGACPLWLICCNAQQHVGEYGVHWNFFFTLCFSALLYSLINVSVELGFLVGGLVLLGMVADAFVRFLVNVCQATSSCCRIMA
jgi:phosphatidylinositol glycan class W